MMHHARIGIARLRARDRDARADLGRLAGALDLRAPGLAPQSILVLRSMRFDVRVPLRTAVNDARAVRAIERGVHGALRQAAARAARPARAPPGESADAVYFEDLAELLACLARDWLAGEAGSRWWWRTVLRDEPVERVLLGYCRKNPEAMPSLLARLAITFDAERFAAAIPRDEARALASAVAKVHGLEHDATAVIRATPPAARFDPLPGGLLRLSTALPECSQPGLDGPSRILLALCLGLRRVPAQVRSPAFAQFVRLVVEESAMPAILAETQQSPRPAPPARPRLEEARSPAEDLVVWRSQHPGAAPHAPHHAPSVPLTEVRVSDTPGVARPTGAPPTLEIVRKDQKTPSLPEQSSRSASNPKPAHNPAFEADASLLACETRFGGLFYVLNAALHMGLYGDFTQPRTRGVELSPWDFLALCGRKWFGRRFETDPLARYLARLAGHDGEDPVAPRWMKRLVPRMEARIAQALGERRPRRAIVRLALASARAVDTGLRVDVHFQLAKLPLAIRYAGLDRDPGWIPAAGRIVAFHFD